MTTTSATFDDAIRAIRLAAAAADPLPHDLPIDDYKRGKALALMPRISFSFPAPGNPRGITVSAVSHRETLEALADRLEKNARAFGGKPPAKVRKKTRTSGYQSARSAFAEGHHRQVHRALRDRLAFVASKSGPLPVMIVEEFERAGHTWAIAWPVFGKTRAPMVVHVVTGLHGTVTKEHGDIMGKDEEFFDQLASGAPATAPALDQSAALDAFLAEDRVESLGDEDIAESEPCDVADAHAALADKIANDAAIHSGDEAPAPCAHSDSVQSHQPADLNGFAREDRGGGAFDLVDGNMRVRVEPTDAGNYQAQLGSARSSPHLQGIAGAVAWASAYREDIKRLQKTSAPTTPAVTCDKASALPSPSPSPSPSAPAPAPAEDSHASATPQLPRLHQKLAQVPDQNAGHGAGSRMEATTENFTRTDSAPVGTCPSSILFRHRTRWRPRRTEDGRRNPLQAEPIRNHNARRWREPWDSVAIAPPRTRAGSMPPIHAVATGERGAYPYHRSIKCRYLSMARKPQKLATPPVQKKLAIPLDLKSWEPRRIMADH